MEYLTHVQIIPTAPADRDASAKQLDRVVGFVTIPYVWDEVCEPKGIRRVVLK